MSNHTPHNVICHKLNATQNKPKQGIVQVIFERFGKDLYLVNQEKMFCESEKILVTSKYEEIEPYRDGELFALETTKDSDNGGECRYLSNSSPTKLVAKDIIEIISLKLPEPSQRIININFLPSTKYIFIEDDDGYLYGAFEYIVRESLSGGFNLELSTPDLFNKSLFNKNIANNYVHKIIIGTESILEAKIKQIYNKFIINIDDASFKENGIYDYRNDESIIQDGNKILKKIGSDGLTKSQVRDLKKDIKDINDLSEIDNNTIKRFFPLLEKMEEWKKIAANLVQEYLKSEHGEEYLNKYIERDKGTYFEEIKSNLEAKAEEETQDLKIEIDDLQERKEGLDNKINSLAEQVREKTEEVREKQQDLENVKPDESLKIVSEEYKKQENELHEVKEKVTKIKDEHKKLNEINDLNEEISYLERKRKETEKENQEIELTSKNIKNKLETENDNFKEMLLEHKTYIDVIYTSKNESNTLKDYSIKICKKEKNNKSQARTEYIEQIHNFFLNNSRNYKKDEIVNLIVSIQQSFLTVLAGLPGIGKTSLVQYLGKALGLNNRLLNISVARGWTSQRDLLGYFNPLNSSYQAAPTGFYELLQATSKENRNTQAPIYVLLDEANLSPIEHYWSNFMIMTDDQNEKILKTGQYTKDADIVIPDALRFIATINYDNTTETLSPRLIDRAPIIKLSPEKVTQTIPKKQINEEFLVYSSQELNDLFSISDGETAELADEEIEVFNKIMKILEDENTDFGQPIIVSQRKQIAITRYCHIARDNMIEEGNLRALDYAICQHILPLINGSGDQYCKRLEKLQEVLPKNHFKLSNAQLERIIKVGKLEIDTFNFFV